jgi:multiple sugar transport system permease protein
MASIYADTPFHTPKRRAGRNADQRLFVLVTLIPAFVAIALFWIYPIVNGLIGSFTDWRAFSTERNWIGLDHYRGLWNDNTFREALVNTFQYVLLYLPLNVAVGLILALAVESSGRLRGFFRTVYFLPVVASAIATALMFKWLYQPQLGLFNRLLEVVGIEGQSYLRSPSQALASIVAYSLWKNVGLTMVLFMAGLNSIDRSFYEAAKVDGAGRWRVFWGITLPLLRPTMVFVVITGIIETLQVFGPVYIMSTADANGLPGGPSNSTMTVAVYQWQAAFNDQNLGYGMAMGMVLFLIILVVTLAQARFLRQAWEY